MRLLSKRNGNYYDCHSGIIKGFLSELKLTSLLEFGDETSEWDRSYPREEWELKRLAKYKGRVKVSEIRYKCVPNQRFLCAMQFHYSDGQSKSPYFSGSHTAKKFKTNVIKIDTS